MHANGVGILSWCTLPVSLTCWFQTIASTLRAKLSSRGCSSKGNFYRDLPCKSVKSVSDWFSYWRIIRNKPIGLGNNGNQVLSCWYVCHVEQQTFLHCHCCCQTPIRRDQSHSLKYMWEWESLRDNERQPGTFSHVVCCFYLLLETCVEIGLNFEPNETRQPKCLCFTEAKGKSHVPSALFREHMWNDGIVLKCLLGTADSVVKH